MLYIVQEEINGIWGASVLSDPKRLEWLADGRVRVCEHLPANVRHQTLFDSQQEPWLDWVSHGGAWSSDVVGEITAPGGDNNALTLNTLWGRDLAVEAELWLTPDSVASLLVRANPSGMAGYRIGLEQAQGTAGLYLLFPAQPETLIQARPVALTSGEWHKLKVVVQGDFLDVYVDDTLVLVRHERTYAEGCFGLHACGEVRVRNLCAYRYVGPEGATPDWERRCKPYHLFRY